MPATRWAVQSRRIVGRLALCRRTWSVLTTYDRPVARQLPHILLDLLRTPVGTSLLMLLALLGIGLGIWVIAKRRIPKWWRGALRWPLGDAVSPKAAHIYGWAGILAGIGLVVVTLALYPSSTTVRLELAMVALVIEIASSVLIVWSSVLSRQDLRLNVSSTGR